MKKLWPYLLPFSVFLITILSTIVRRGIFIDGLIYVNLAKNLSQGIGSFWQPKLNPAGAVFFDHPPLVFTIESWFFRVLGTNFPAEDVYNLVIFGLTVWLLYGIWKALTGKDQQVLFYFPLTFWILSEEVQLRYANNLLECTMTVFLLLGFWLYWKWRQSKPILALLSLALFSLAAFLAKGPVGLFLLAAPFLDQGFLQAKFLRAVLYSLIVGAFLGIAVVSLFTLFPDAQEGVLQYIDQQVLSALQGKRHENIQTSRFAIMIALLEKNLITWILLGIIVAIPKFKSVEWPGAKIAIFLLLIGFCGIAPIMISTKQASYYQLPSLPFFILATSMLIKDRLFQIHHKLMAFATRNLWIKWSSLIFPVLGIAIVLSNWGKDDRRDQLILEEVDKISLKLGAEKSINYTIAKEIKVKSSYPYYNHAGYLNRYYDVYVDEQGGAKPTLFIRKDNFPEAPHQECEKVVLAQQSSVLLGPCSAD